MGTERSGNGCGDFYEWVGTQSSLQRLTEAFGEKPWFLNIVGLYVEIYGDPVIQEAYAAMRQQPNAYNAPVGR